MVLRRHIGPTELFAYHDFMAEWRKEEQIGEGGFAVIHRVVRDDGTAFDGKFLAPQYTQNPDVVARFSREVKLQQALELSRRADSNCQPAVYESAAR